MAEPAQLYRQAQRATHRCRPCADNRRCARRSGANRCHTCRPCADHRWPPPTKPQRPAAADASAIARAFVDWAIAHETNGTLGRAIPVDHLWWLASADFAAVHGITMPPRRVFLGALQKLPGVTVEYDRRVHCGRGRTPRKTTFYRLDAVQPAEQLSLPLAA